MKRKFILLPITLVSFTPMIGLVGCNNPNTPEEKTEFTIGTGKMTSATEGTFQFNWDNGHSLTFGTDWEFTTSAGTVKSVTATGGDTRPQTVSITFDKEIMETDITDGKLTFTYSDLTTKKDNISATLENICITKYTPPIPPEPVPPTPEECIVLNDFNTSAYGNHSLYSTEKFFIESNTSYCFQIDVDEWEAPTEKSHYYTSAFSICYKGALGEDAHACKFSDDFQIWIDDNLLDSSLWRVDKWWPDCIEIDPEGLEQILNAKKSVVGRIHVLTLECEPTVECYFKWYAEVRK